MEPLSTDWPFVGTLRPTTGTSSLGGLAGMCLAWSLREGTERGVYAASASHSPVTLRNSAGARKAQTVKRPEGRAPTPLLRRALNSLTSGRNPKSQAPEKSQAPNSNDGRPARVLELEIWSFFGIWCLVFGAFITTP